MDDREQIADPDENGMPISEVLLAIMNVSRAMPVDVDATLCIPPDDFDVLLTDIKDSDIMLIGEELEHANLSDAVDDASFPVDGTFYGDYLRVFVALTVRKKTNKSDNCKWVLFLLDTGSPFTFLTHDTLRHLGFTESIPGVTQVLINGESLAVSPSHGHFHNVNLLGQNFMRAARLNVRLDYVKGSVRMARTLTYSRVN